MDWAIEWISDSRWSTAVVVEEGAKSCCCAREGVEGERTDRDCEGEESGQ